MKITKLELFGTLRLAVDALEEFDPSGIELQCVAAAVSDIFKAQALLFRALNMLRREAGLEPERLQKEDAQAE